MTFGQIYTSRLKDAVAIQKSLNANINIDKTLVQFSSTNLNQKQQGKDAWFISLQIYESTANY